MSITKFGNPNPVAAGGVLTYTLSISNEGPDNAATVSLQDVLPSGTTFQSLTPPGGWSCTTPAVGTGGTVTCSLATFPTGSADFTLNVVVDSGTPNGTVLSNTATVTSTTSDPNTNNNEATATTTVQAPVPTLSITKTGAPDPVDAGANLSYTITAGNSGVVPLDTATVSDTLPSGTTFVSLNSPPGWSCTTPAVGAAGTVDCSITPMPGSSAVFTLVVHVSSAQPAGSLPNQATFFSSSGGRETTLTGSTSTQVQISDDIAVTKTDTPDPVTAGSNVVYTIGLTNSGPSDAATVSLSDPLPAGTTFVSLVSPGGWSCSTPAVGSTGTVTCSGSVVASGTATFTLTVTTNIASPATTLTNVATVTAANDTNSANNSSTALTTVALNPTTTTTIDAPTVTYNANGIVTVAVSAPGAAPTGNVTLIVDGGAPLTQPLSPASATSSSAVFTLTSPSVGVHTLQANYPAQNGFNASSASGTLTVLPAVPALGAMELMLLAIMLAAVAMRSRMV